MFLNAVSPRLGTVRGDAAQIISRLFHCVECSVDGTKEDRGDGERGIIWRNQGKTGSRRNSR